MITFEQLEAMGFDAAQAALVLLLRADIKWIVDPEVTKWVTKHAHTIVMRRYKDGAPLR